MIKLIFNRKVKKVPFILQMETCECGAASLAMILAYFGKWITLEQAREICGVSRDGVNIKNILKAAISYGLEVEKKTYSTKEFQESNQFPCIVKLKNNKFIVVNGFNKNIFDVNDPSKGNIKINAEDFKKIFSGDCLYLYPSEKFEPSGKPRNILEFIKYRLKGTFILFIFLLLITALTSIINIINPVFSRIFIDRLLTLKNPEWFIPFIIIMIFVAAIQVLATVLQSLYSLKIQGHFAVSSTKKFLWHTLHLPMQFFYQRSAGDISQRQSNNETLAYSLIQQATPILINIFIVIFYLVIMINYNLMLTIIGVLSVILNIFVAAIISNKRNRIVRIQLKDMGKLSSLSVSGIEMIETIKANSLENEYFSKWANCNTLVCNQEAKYGKINAYIALIPTFVSSATNVIILIAGVYLTMIGHFTVGMIVAFQSFLSAFASPANSLITTGQSIQEMQTYIERIDDVMKYPEDDILNTNTNFYDKLEKLNGNLTIKNLTFGYSKFEEPVVKNFNISLKKGQKVALVGPSGCGKSTILKLIAGLYKPWSGEVEFDDKSINSIPKNTIVNSISIVNQEIFLFEDSIFNNICMWDKSISKDEIIKAAKDAQIHQDIICLEEGYDHKLLEEGKNFSGGQRQRLEIACALAKKPSILILDEATNALDSSTEEQVIDAISKRNISCLIVAHRLSSIKNCDEILVIDKGKVVERGKHEDLMKLNGIYTKLVKVG